MELSWDGKRITSHLQNSLTHAQGFLQSSHLHVTFTCNHHSHRGALSRTCTLFKSYRLYYTLTVKLKLITALRHYAESESFFTPWTSQSIFQ